MGLIAEAILDTVEVNIENATNIYIPLEKEYLSIPYELPNLSKIEAELLRIQSLEPLPPEDIELIKRLQGIAFELILLRIKRGKHDLLFITNNSWIMIRDYGILPKKFAIRIKIIRAIYNGESVDIFPLRDVYIE